MTETRAYATARQGLRTRLAEGYSRRARARRGELFRRLIAPRPGESAVDLGCGAGGLAASEPELEITGVDRDPRPGYPGARYSNSVVEHLPPGAREAYARELRRIGRRWFVQTPNRWFPIEPHALLPFVHWVPRAAGRALWRLGVSGDPYDEVRLLGARELQELFPDAVIVRERAGPLTKSLVAVGPRERIAR